MKIAIHNHFFCEKVAETELAQRIIIAANKLGGKAQEFAYSQDIKKFGPDFVLALHFKTPKLTPYPTYGCMWNPPSFFEQDEEFIKNILSYDGYLCASEAIEKSLKIVLYNTPKKYLFLPFYPSCQGLEYQAPNLNKPNLIYLGSNWDKLRHKQLFLELDKQEYTRIYGNKKNWQYLRKSYQDEIPFDGRSVINFLRQNGVGLCLHKSEHSDTATPSMRIFEIAASGAIALCGEHKFIREYFGDSVFYLDQNLTVVKQVEQISKYINWIGNNQEKALQMSEKAYQIFNQQFSLEILLQKIVEFHQKIQENKGFINLNITPQKRVEIIVRAGNRPIKTIKRALDSILEQTYKNIGIILVIYKDIIDLDKLLNEYQNQIDIKIIKLEKLAHRSTALWTGINAIESEYFGILDDDDVYYNNHINTLISLLEEYPKYGVAYSGAIRVWEEYQINKIQIDNQELASLFYFNPYKFTDFMRFSNFIVSNGFIAKTSLIENYLKQDPELDVLEDFFLLLNLSKITKFIFSYEVTCQVYHRLSKKDNSVFESEEIWENNAEKIKKMMWNEEFIYQDNIENLRTLALENKFWQLIRKIWLKLKNKVKQLNNISQLLNR